MIDKLKRDKEENWCKAVNFIPKQDEIIIYDCIDGPKMKVGDGLTKVNDLPFVESDIVQLDDNHRIEDGILVIGGK